MRRFLLVVAVVMAMVGMSGAVMPTPALADSRNVDSWIELSTVTPSPGCAIDVSIEVRSGGAPVAGAEIELALHQEQPICSRPTTA